MPRLGCAGGRCTSKLLAVKALASSTTTGIDTEAELMFTLALSNCCRSFTFDAPSPLVAFLAFAATTHCLNSARDM